jgi:hypothetical protein
MSNSVSDIKAKKLHQELQITLATISKKSTKKFIYESGYKPQILKPRPFVPEIKYTPNSTETKLETKYEALLIPSFAYAGALVLAILMKRML